MKRKNFELRTRSEVLKINLDSTGKRATGVTYIDAQGQEVEQPANMVIVAAFQFHNVRLMLLSGIGKPYDPVSQEGAIGKNFAYRKGRADQPFHRARLRWLADRRRV
jgi:gluconate 2-dehydrogenase alpha chain